MKQLARFNASGMDWEEKSFRVAQTTNGEMILGQMGTTFQTVDAFFWISNNYVMMEMRNVGHCSQQFVVIWAWEDDREIKALLKWGLEIEAHLQKAEDMSLHTPRVIEDGVQGLSVDAGLINADDAPKFIERKALPMSWLTNS